MANESTCNATEAAKDYIRDSDSIAQQLICSGVSYTGANVLAESIILAIVYFVGNILALMGNGFVVYTSSKYGTFALDKVTITFVQHLAIADIIFILVYPAPMAITHMARKFVLGVWVCKAIGYGISVPGTANINFILAVSLHRFVRCAWPMRAHLLTERRANKVVVLTWVLSCSMLAYFIGMDVHVDFVPEIATCSFHFQNTFRNYHLVLWLMAVALPCATIFIINISLWAFVHTYTKRHPLPKNRGPTNKKESTASCSRSHKAAAAIKASSEKRIALITTSSITALFVLTWIPTVIRFLVATWPGHSVLTAGESGAAHIPSWLEKLRIIYIFGSWGNPVIYTMINKRFRRFLALQIREVCKCNKSERIQQTPRMSTVSTDRKFSLSHACGRSPGFQRRFSKSSNIIEPKLWTVDDVEDEVSGGCTALSITDTKVSSTERRTSI